MDHLLADDVDHLLADDSHEILSLIQFLTAGKKLRMSSAVNFAAHLNIRRDLFKYK